MTASGDAARARGTRSRTAAARTEASNEARCIGDSDLCEGTRSSRGTGAVEQAKVSRARSARNRHGPGTKRPCRRRTVLAEVRDRRAVVRVGLDALDQWVRLELLSHRGAHGACAAAVDNADERKTGECRVVCKAANALARLGRGQSAH